MIRVIRDQVQEELFFFIALFLAATTSIITGFNISAIDWHVIWSLLVLMGFALVFEKYHLLDAGLSY
jgi:di/tricarboxylate transporter